MVTGHVAKPSARKGHNGVVIEYGRDPATGKRRIKEIRLHRESGDDGTLRPFRKAEAQAELDRILTEIRKGTYVEPADLTVAAFLSTWLGHMKHRLDEAAYDNYRMLVESHIIPHLGGILLATLQPLQLEQLYDRLLVSGRVRGGGALSRRTVALVHFVLKRALRQGVRWRLIARSPADEVERPKTRSDDEDGLPAGGSALGAEQAIVFLAAIRESALWPRVATALATGFRRREVLGLQRADLDLAARTLRVRRALRRLPSGRRLGRAKTAQSRPSACSPSP